MTAPLPVRTHLEIDTRFSGEPLELGEGSARVGLATLPEMAADELGLVHGGFVFSLADHAAMLAVNHPLVVLAGAEVRFLQPVRVGETLVAAARVVESAGKRRQVEVEVTDLGGAVVFSGTFRCAVPDRHVLERAAAPVPPSPGRSPGREESA
jgi:uncharacterized protein (TIGR00369 family)